MSRELLCAPVVEHMERAFARVSCLLKNSRARKVGTDELKVGAENSRSTENNLFAGKIMLLMVCGT